MGIWLLIQLLVITSFIAGYLIGSGKRVAVKQAVEKLNGILPQSQYKILQKKQPQTQDEKTLEQLEKNFNAKD